MIKYKFFAFIVSENATFSVARKNSNQRKVISRLGVYENTAITTWNSQNPHETPYQLFLDEHCSSYY